MSQITINISKVKEEATNFKETVKIIKNIDQSVMGIASSLAITTACSTDIKKLLKDVHEHLLEKAVKMDKLSDALLRIAELYEKTEKQIIAEIKIWMMKYNIITPQKQERKEDETVTAYQQKEQDLYMQKEIERLNKDERFSEEAWNNASTEERKDILNAYVKELSDIMGLSIDEVDFFESLPKDGYVKNGYYSDRNDSININEWTLDNRSRNDIYQTMAHEMRHAYQHAACEDPDKFVVTEENVEKWKKSFDEYKNSDGFMEEGMTREEAHEAYRNQEVEKDARNFAKQK